MGHRHGFFDSFWLFDDADVEALVLDGDGWAVAGRSAKKGRVHELVYSAMWHASWSDRLARELGDVCKYLAHTILRDAVWDAFDQIVVGSVSREAEEVA